ncbi:MAG: DUF308 domain-containing protein [Alphaproteobacteria bacterium]|nr:DUF308 domain-containing protein [Alphaproteobacteria bacterium]
MAEKETKQKRTTKQTRTEQVVKNPVAHGVQRLYDRSAPLLLAEALLLLIAGIVMMWRPVGLLTILTLVLGGALILFGLYRTIAGFVASRGYGGGWLDVLFGLINVGVGVLFCAYPLGSMISLVYVFVILFLFKALRTLVFAINMARVRFGHWVFNLVMSVILVGLAILLLFYPTAGAVALVVYLAITLLMYAFADIYMFFELRRLKRVVVD